MTVRVESTGGVSRLTIDRPEVRNAITDDGMIEDICSAVEAAEATRALADAIAARAAAW